MPRRTPCGPVPVVPSFPAPTPAPAPAPGARCSPGERPSANSCGSTCPASGRPRCPPATTRPPPSPTRSKRTCAPAHRRISVALTASAARWGSSRAGDGPQRRGPQRSGSQRRRPRLRRLLGARRRSRSSARRSRRASRFCKRSARPCRPCSRHRSAGRRCWPNCPRGRGPSTATTPSARSRVWPRRPTPVQRSGPYRPGRTRRARPPARSRNLCCPCGARRTASRCPARRARCSSASQTPSSRFL